MCVCVCLWEYGCVCVYMSLRVWLCMCMYVCESMVVLDFMTYQTLPVI